MDQNQPANPPKSVEQKMFNALMNKLLFNSGFYVASSLKEKPRFEGDFSVYHVNIIINNSVLDCNSDLMKILNEHCNIVQVSNDARFPNQILIGSEIYVSASSQPMQQPAVSQMQTMEETSKNGAGKKTKKK